MSLNVGAGTGIGASRFAQRLFRARAEDALPMRIEHRRIYILPTGRGWAFLGALLLMLIASVNYSLSLGYALAFLLTGLFSATLLHTYRNLAGIEIAQIEPGEGFAGSSLDVEAILGDASGRARTGIVVATRARASAVVDVPAGDAAGAVLALATERRGPLALGRLTLSSDWPLGLWHAWSYVHAPVHALVRPAPEPDPPPLPHGPDGDDEGERRASNDGDVAGLRAYAAGDAPSRIAWKRAARGGPLQVRLLEDELGRARTELTFESTRLGGDEARLSRLVAWVLEAERRGVEYHLRLPSSGTAGWRAAAPESASATESEPGIDPRLESDHGPARRRAALDALAAWGHPPPASEAR